MFVNASSMDRNAPRTTTKDDPNVVGEDTPSIPATNSHDQLDEQRQRMENIRKRLREHQRQSLAHRRNIVEIDKNNSTNGDAIGVQREKHQRAGQPSDVFAYPSEDQHTNRSTQNSDVTSEFDYNAFDTTLNAMHEFDEHSTAAPLGSSTVPIPQPATSGTARKKTPRSTTPKPRQLRVTRDRNRTLHARPRARRVNRSQESPATSVNPNGSPDMALVDNQFESFSQSGYTPPNIANITNYATRTQSRVTRAKRVISDHLGSHYLTHQNISSLQRDVKPLALLVRNVSQTLRDVALGGSSANTQLESTLCDMLLGVLEQWHVVVKDCIAHSQRTHRFLEAMYQHLHNLTDSVDNIQAGFLHRQCHMANAAGHVAVVHGIIARRQAAETEQASGIVRPTGLWGNAAQLNQLPMFVASRAICATHAPNSFKGIAVEFTPRRRNTARTSRRAAASRKKDA